MSVRLGLLAGTACLILSGCQFVPGTHWHNEKEAQAAVAGMLNDPASAKFREIRSRITDGDKGKISIVCGEVNGRNGFGAYAGYRRFLYAPAKRNGAIDPAFTGTQSDFDREVRLCELNNTITDCPRAREWRQNFDNQSEFNGIWDRACKPDGAH